jgi:acetylornithine/N-succinyldiaminopimelate aminotransferase
MGNGFPIGGILVHPNIEAQHGMLGTTFGGNHLACRASLAVLDILQKDRLQEHAKHMESYFREKAEKLSAIKKVKGRGLMLGIEFDFEVGPLRKSLIYDHHIFTGGSSHKKLIRILPPLTVQKHHIDYFFSALEKALEQNTQTA